MTDAAPPPPRARALTTVLVLAAVLPFLQSLAFGYVLDDTYAIRGNVSLRGWSSLGRVWLEQFGGDGGPFFGLYRPLTMTVFAVVFNAGAKWPLWLHLLALVLHAIATVLVWKLLRRALAWWPAFLAAAWFAVHPLHVEAVANITNTSEVLVAIWTLLLSLFLLRRWGANATSWTTAAIAGLLYLAAMFSKESGAMAAPVAMLILWGWGERSPRATEFLKHSGKIIAAFALAVIVVAVSRAVVLGGPVTGKPIAALGLAAMTATEREYAMVSLVPRIVRLLLWPPGVNPHYGPSTFPEQRVAYVALGLAILGAAVGLAAWRSRRADRRWLAALGVALLSFLPASNILVATGQVLAERTLYLPSVGAAMLAGVAIERVSAWMRSRGLGARWGQIAAGALGLLLLLSAARAMRWTQHWRSHDRLFARMIAADPAGYAGYWLAGVEATLQKRPTEGLALFEKAYALERRDRGLVLDYGASLTNHGQFERAAEVYREGLKLAPRDSTLNARLRALPAR
jgi:hypothetical protein